MENGKSKEPCLCDLCFKRFYQLNVKRIDYEQKRPIEYRQKVKFKKNVNLAFDFCISPQSRKFKISVESKVRIRCHVAVINGEDTLLEQFRTSDNLYRYECVELLNDLEDRWDDLWKNDPDQISFNFQVSEDVRDFCAGGSKCGIRRRHMSNLMESLKHVSDFEATQMVSMVVGDEKELVNKSILCACSPVFSAMFQTPMKEHECNSVVIEDLKFSTVQKFICFMYTAEVENLDAEDLQELCYAGDKYQMPDLMTYCTKLLLGKLSTKSFVNILEFADNLNEKRLKGKVLNYMRKNIIHILRTDDWRQLLESNPKLALEVFTCPFEALCSDNNKDEFSLI